MASVDREHRRCLGAAGLGVWMRRLLPDPVDDDYCRIVLLGMIGPKLAPPEDSVELSGAETVI